MLVDIDPNNVLDELSTEDIVAYLKEDRRYENIKDDSGVSIDDYWHGDFDLKAFLKELGPAEIKKVLLRLIKDNEEFETAFAEIVNKNEYQMG